MKAEYKNIVAEKVGISAATLSKWLNKRYYEQLKDLGYYKTQKLLTPAQIKKFFQLIGYSE